MTQFYSTSIYLVYIITTDIAYTCIPVTLYMKNMVNNQLLLNYNKYQTMSIIIGMKSISIWWISAKETKL